MRIAYAISDADPNVDAYTQAYTDTQTAPKSASSADALAIRLKD
jgi:hypothetical protein